MLVLLDGFACEALDRNGAHVRSVCKLMGKVRDVNRLNKDKQIENSE